MTSRHSVLDEQVYDRVRPAINVLRDALGISPAEARSALRELARAGYFVAPRLPTNAMLGAYLNAYGRQPVTARSAIIGVGKARLRWAAMGESGMAMAMSTRRCDSDGSGEAGETGTGSTEGDSAGLQGIAQNTVPASHNDKQGSG